MAQDKFGQVYAGLLAKTRLGEIEWREAPGDNQYIASLGNSSITVENSASAEIIVRVFNSSGDEVNTYILENDEASNALFELARSQVLGVDETLDDLLRGLG